MMPCFHPPRSKRTLVTNCANAFLEFSTKFGLWLLFRHFKLKFGPSEKGTKFEKIFHFLLSSVKLKVEDFFKFCALLRKSKLYLIVINIIYIFFVQVGGLCQVFSITPTLENITRNVYELAPSLWFDRPMESC